MPDLDESKNQAMDSAQQDQDQAGQQSESGKDKMMDQAKKKLDTNQDDPVMILANDKPVAKGEIEIQGDKIAVSVVELLQSYT